MGPLLAFTIAAFVVLTSLKPYRIISGSMAPTADVGQRVFADHVGSHDWDPKTGDIIVFKAPGGARDDAAAECAEAARRTRHASRRSAGAPTSRSSSASSDCLEIACASCTAT